MKKKLIAFLMAVVLFAGVTGTGPASAAQFTEDELADRILYVKDVLGISDSYTEFSQNVWDYGDDVEWSFSWNTPDYNNSIYVNVDGDNHIKSYSRYEYSDSSSYALPTGFAEEYEAVAQAFIKKAMPELDGHIALSSTSINYWDNVYSFNYQRVENGYPVNYNSVNVRVDYRDKTVKGADASWDYSVKIAKPGNLITKEEASSKLSGKLDFELRYISRYKGDGKEVFLAYVPSTGYLSVDATTGKVYTQRDYYDDGMSKESAALDEETADMAVRGGNGATLTDAEMKKIQEVSNLISKEEAIAVITSNKSLYIDENIKSTNAALRSNRNGYVWQISMRDPRPEDYSTGDYYRAYASATVDAATGRLLYFYSSVKEYYNYDDPANVELKYSKKDCIKRFEKFAKALEPELFKQTTKTNDTGGYIVFWDYSKDTPTYGGRNYTYTRVVNGVPFYDDWIRGAVDRVTGKVYSYSCNWTEDIEFPSVDGVIGTKAAFDRYLASDDFKLVYEITTNTKLDPSTYISKTTSKSRLCYVTDISAPYVDAFTGKLLNYNGDEYKPYSPNCEFSDITGHKYEKEIKFIAQLTNCIEGDRFEPDKGATYEFLAKIFDNIWYFNSRPQVESSDKAITRQDLARICIDALGYKALAELDIYSLNFKDASKISAKNKGAVALACGLGLFNVKSGSKFNPKSKVTRGELAAVLARALAANGGRY
ncbi:MAG: S-layer homology domain-containing protein [Lachnospiraceae bacterium]|nr:S-layer homology domain-containing protein [Lachnospiraceae bacterium]